MIDVKVSGPLFEGRLDVKAGLREGVEEIATVGSEIIRRHLAQRTRYRTAKWGHVADSVRKQVKVLPSGDIGARLYLGGKSAWLGPILEGGVVAHFLAPKRLKRRGGSRSALAILQPGGGVLYRAFAHHPGAPAFHWRQQSQAELAPQIQGILDRALARRLSA